MRSTEVFLSAEPVIVRGKAPSASLVIETEPERGCSHVLFVNGVEDEIGFALKEGGATVDTAAGGLPSGFTDPDRLGLLPTEGLGLLDGGGGARPL